MLAHMTKYCNLDKEEEAAAARAEAAMGGAGDVEETYDFGTHRN